MREWNINQSINNKKMSASNFQIRVVINEIENVDGTPRNNCEFLKNLADYQEKKRSKR